MKTVIGEPRSAPRALHSRRHRARQGLDISGRPTGTEDREPCGGPTGWERVGERLGRAVTGGFQVGDTLGCFLPAAPHLLLVTALSPCSVFVVWWKWRHRGWVLAFPRPV